jgi:hypothetical protein
MVSNIYLPEYAVGKSEIMKKEKSNKDTNSLLYEESCKDEENN